MTVAGESAGAIAVGALVGSPEAAGLFHRAIGQSGAWLGLAPGRMTNFEAAEAAGQRFAEEAGASTLAGLRAIPAEELSGGSGGAVIDGWIVPEDLTATFAEGRQNAVDVLVGSNEDGLPEWPQFTGDDNPDIMILGAQVMAGTGTPSESLEFFDRYFETLLQE